MRGVEQEKANGKGFNDSQSFIVTLESTTFPYALPRASYERSGKHDKYRQKRAGALLGLGPGDVPAAE